MKAGDIIEAPPEDLRCLRCGGEANDEDVEDIRLHEGDITYRLHMDCATPVEVQRWFGEFD